MVAPLHLPSPPRRDAALDAALDELAVRHHPTVRAAVATLAALRGHLATQAPALSSALDELEAVIGAALAREARVLVPHLRALAAGVPDHTLFASLAALTPVLADDQRAATAALGQLRAALAAAEHRCAVCVTAADAAADLAGALAAHHRFTVESLLPRARTRELALGSVPAC
ncbi:MAG: hypothetical protein JNK64_41170 [Myxococcales bacterium]|nr:hypothetical protein [Myxococcales bacterium]